MLSDKLPHCVYRCDPGVCWKQGRIGLSVSYPLPQTLAEICAYRRRYARAERRARAMIVSAGLAGRALGKMELSAIHRFGMSWLRPTSSTTDDPASVPIRQVPMVWAERWKVQMSVAPAAFQTSVIMSSAWVDILV